MAVSVERPPLAREGTVPRAVHIVPIEQQSIEWAAVNLPPHLYWVGAHEVLPPGTEYVTLKQDVQNIT